MTGLSTREEQLQHPDFREGGEPRNRRCLLCDELYAKQLEGGYSEGTCDRHVRCTALNGSCREGAHPSSELDFCAWCERDGLRNLVDAQWFKIGPWSQEELALADQLKDWTVRATLLEQAMNRPGVGRAA